jgi:hypothetical protein
MKIAKAKKSGVLIGEGRFKTDSQCNEWFNREYPDGHTLEIQDGPDDLTRAELKAIWNQVTDPAAKQLLKILLKDMIEDD